MAFLDIVETVFTIDDNLGKISKVAKTARAIINEHDLKGRIDDEIRKLDLSRCAVENLISNDDANKECCSHNRSFMLHKILCRDSNFLDRIYRSCWTICEGCEKVMDRVKGELDGIAAKISDIIWKDPEMLSLLSDKDTQNLMISRIKELEAEKNVMESRLRSLEAENEAMRGDIAALKAERDAAPRETVISGGMCSPCKGFYGREEEVA